MINKDIVEEFINTLSEIPDYQVFIYNHKGVLIGNTLKNTERRLSSEIWAFLYSNTPTTAIKENGHNSVLSKIYKNSKLAGCIEVSGKDDALFPIALALKMSIEIRLKYDQIQIEEEQILNINEKLFDVLLNDVNNIQKIKNLYEQSQRSINIPRRMFILIPVQPNIKNLRNMDFFYDSSEDITILKDDCVIILKDMTKAKDSENEYSKEFIKHIYDITSFEGTILIGYTSKTYDTIKESFKNLTWLRDYIHTHKIKSGFIFFKDYIDDYFLSNFPFEILDNIFRNYIYEDDEKIFEFIETTNALIHNNFNIVRSSKELYIHKNTLMYRLEKIKKEFDLNPSISEADRSFLKYLNYYMKYIMQMRRENV